MKKLFTVLILTYLLFTINSSAVIQNSNEDIIENEKILKIGVLLPLSGKFQDIGQSFLKAIQLALFDLENENIISTYEQAAAEGSFDEHLKLAKFFTSNINTNQTKNSVLMTYSDALFYFGKWYMQLWAESIGKDGKGITPIHAVGTTDQHSQLQLYLGGPKDKFFSFITTNHSKLGLKIHKKTLKFHCIGSSFFCNIN